MRKLVVDTIGNVGAFVTAKLRGVVMMVTLAHVAGIAEYGAWIQVLTVAGVFSLIGGLGLPNGLVRFYPEADRTGTRAQLLSNVLVPAAIASALSGLIVLLLSSAFADLFTDGEHRLAFALGGALATLMPLRLLLASWFRAQDKLTAFSRAQAGWELADFAVALPLLLIFETVEAALIGSVLAALFVTAWLVGHCIKDAGGLVGPDRNMRRYLRYSVPIVPTAMADESLARGDRLIIGAMLGPAAAGVYSATYALASVTQMVNSALFNSLLPKVIRVHDDSGERGRLWLRRAAGWYGLTAAAAVALLIPIVPWLARLMTDGASDAERITLIYVLCGLGVVLFGVGRLVSAELFVGMRTGTVALIWGGAALLNVILNLILVSRIDLLGAAAASAISYAVFLALQSLMVARLHQTTDVSLSRSGGPAPLTHGD